MSIPIMMPVDILKLIVNNYQDSALTVSVGVAQDLYLYMGFVVY